MALDSFRRVDFRLNKANDYIPDNFFAKEGDYNGRELVVQITNGSVVTETQGIQMILNWKHLNKGHSGNKYFEGLDITKGIYKVSYPTQMLFAGKVSCFITIVDNEKITNTRNFNLKVEAGADGNLIVAENDFSILQQALIQINQYQNQIDNIKSDLIRQVDELLNTEQTKFDELYENEKEEFDYLQANYAPLLQSLQSQFDNVIANVTVDSELIAVRSSGATGKSYDSAGTRIDDVENRQIIKNIDDGNIRVGFLEVENGRPRLRIEEVI